MRMTNIQTPSFSRPRSSRLTVPTSSVSDYIKTRRSEGTDDVSTQGGNVLARTFTNTVENAGTGSDFFKLELDERTFQKSSRSFSQQMAGRTG